MTPKRGTVDPSPPQGAESAPSTLRRGEGRGEGRGEARKVLRNKSVKLKILPQGSEELPKDQVPIQHMDQP